MLHDCVRSGPSSQDRERVLDFRGHPTGRVAWVALHDAARGARLRATLDGVDRSR